MPTMWFVSYQNRIACDVSQTFLRETEIVSNAHSNTTGRESRVPVFLYLGFQCVIHTLFPHTESHAHSNRNTVSWITISTTWLSQYQSEYELYLLLQLGRYHQTQLHGVWLAGAYSRLYLLLQKTSPRHSRCDTPISFVHLRSVQIVYNTI
jgi:hypothetical protein